jgi:hypothetical protein
MLAYLAYLAPLTKTTRLVMVTAAIERCLDVVCKSKHTKHTRNAINNQHGSVGIMCPDPSFLPSSVRMQKYRISFDSDA